MTVLVYGATGFTGRLVTAALRRRGIELTLAGRDRHRLQAAAGQLDAETPIRVARVHDAGELDAAVRDHRVVVNCAGPFAKLGEPVVRAAVDAGAHYLDTTGEQAFMRRIYESYESAARKANVAVVNGCAFEIALGDWAAARAAGHFDHRCDHVWVAYAMDKFVATAGTKLSAVDSLAADGVIWNVDRWDSVRPAAERKLVVFPPPFGERTALSFPSGEVITVPRHTDTQRVQTYVSLTDNSLATRAMGLLGPALPFVLRSPLLTAAAARAGQSGDGPTTDERRNSAFAVVAVASEGGLHQRTAVIGSDPYGVTAEILAYAAAFLLDTNEAPSGVLAPSELIASDRALPEVAERCFLEVSDS